MTFKKVNTESCAAQGISARAAISFMLALSCITMLAFIVLLPRKVAHPRTAPVHCPHWWR